MSRNRYENNIKILEILNKFLNKNKDLRFIQALWSLNIIDKEDRFYEESKETLSKINILK